jgi:hypothetical protein
MPCAPSSTNRAGQPWVKPGNDDRFNMTGSRYSVRRGHMVSINEELKAAKAAKAAIDSLSTTPLSKSVFLAALNKANHAAILNLSSGGALNEARGNVGIVLSNLMYGPRTQEKIDKAKFAIDVWIRELETSPAA